MVALLYLPEVVLVAVYSRWDAGLGQVEFRGAGGLVERQRYRIRQLALM